MFTLFILGIVLFVFKLVLFAVRAAWGITKVLVFIIGIPLMLLAAALSVLTGVLTRHGGRRSAAGTRLLGQILGFRRFLLRTSESHLAMRLQRDPQYFYRTLPYAEAMGLGAMFARKFGDTELDPCEWYNEPNLPRTAEGFYEKLKETLKGEDTDAIKAATEELTQLFYKMSEKLYQQAAPQGDPNMGGQPGGDAGNGGQQYYDADYKVVDDDEQNNK